MLDRQLFKTQSERKQQKIQSKQIQHNWKAKIKTISASPEPLIDAAIEAEKEDGRHHHTLWLSLGWRFRRVYTIKRIYDITHI